MSGEVFKTGSGRVWTIQFRAGPENKPKYNGMGMAGALDWGQGDVDKIEIPSDTNYNEWTEIDSFQSSADRPTVSLTVRLTHTRSDILDLIRLRCAFDVQVHLGNCEELKDFDRGWQKIVVIEDARATGYSTTDLGALSGDGQGAIDEELPVSGKWIYNILRMAFREVAAALVSEEIVSVDVCDSIQCGDCDNPSDGCSTVLAVSNPAGSSPGILPQVIVTVDGYATSFERWITTLIIGETVSDAVCVGEYYVVASESGEELHYAPLADIKDQAEVWTAVATGFVAGNGPLAMWSYSPQETWIVGENGYIYVMENVPDGVAVQDAGAATTNDLNDVDGWDSETLVAVGDSNTVVFTTDGETWQAITGPSVGNDLICVAMRRKNEWWVGDDTGSLFYTLDQGQHWTEVTLSGSPAQIDDIVWASDSVGFLAAQTAAPAGKLYRTINGGYSWYRLPETATTAIPAHDYINSLAVCQKEVNILYAGGLADDGADGIILKGSDL